MLKEMIRRDRDKASVLMWSLSNETATNDPTRTKFLTDLAAEARSLDATRLITSALFSQVHGDAGSLTDRLAEALDVIGINEYVGWYGGKPADADKIEWTLPNKPIIVSEFGAGAKYGNHGPVTERWTEEQEADVYKHQLVMFRKIPQLRGITPWVLFDFRSTTRNIPRLQDGFNRKGLLSEKGEKKQAFFVLQKAYEDHNVGKPE